MPTQFAIEWKENENVTADVADSDSLNWLRLIFLCKVLLCFCYVNTKEKLDNLIRVELVERISILTL